MDIDISDPLLTWNPRVLALELTFKQAFGQIAKFPNIELLIAENEGTSEPVNIHLLTHLQYVFLANNELTQLAQFKKIHRLSFLDLSNNNLSLLALKSLQRVQIDYFVIYGNKRLAAELANFNDFQRPAQFAGRSYPGQEFCSCRLLYNNSYAELPFGQLLFLIRLLPEASYINYTLINTELADFSLEYVNHRQSTLTPLQKLAIEDLPAQFREEDQNYFRMREFLLHLSAFKEEQCSCCSRCSVPARILSLQPARAPAANFLEYIIIALRVARAEYLHSFIEEFRSKIEKIPKNQYGKLVLATQKFSAELFSEIYQLVFSQSTSCLQLGICTLENDAFAGFVVGQIERNNGQKAAFRTLQELYAKILQWGAAAGAREEHEHITKFLADVTQKLEVIEDFRKNSIGAINLQNTDVISNVGCEGDAAAMENAKIPEDVMQMFK